MCKDTPEAVPSGEAGGGKKRAQRGHGLLSLQLCESLSPLSTENSENKKVKNKKCEGGEGTLVMRLLARVRKGN